VRQFQEACNYVLKEQGAQALQYSTTEGYRPLREMLAQFTARYAVSVTPENILIHLRLAAGAGFHRAAFHQRRRPHCG